jgi:tripartite-type tricarboxylate transporter receptor subunit TctC
MKLRHRRNFLHLAAVSVALPMVSRVAVAQAYPSRPVRLIVATSAGGGNDIVARLMGQWLSERFGQQFVVDNRPGAGSNIGTEAVVRAPADGYTLLLVSASNAINATLYEKLTFNFIQDIAPVAGIMRTPNVMLVNPGLPSRTLLEFIDYAKANPGKVNMASGGNGTPSHMSGELFKMMAGVNLVHVPYRGLAPALNDMIGGQVQLMFGGTTASFPYVAAGKLRALAVTGTARSDLLPDVPSVDEFVPGYESSQWYGIGAPKNTPTEIIDKLNMEINAALADAKIKARLADLGGPGLPGPPAQFAKMIADETEKWGKVVKFAGIKAD